MNRFSFTLILIGVGLAALESIASGQPVQVTLYGHGAETFGPG